MNNRFLVIVLSISLLTALYLNVKLSVKLKTLKRVEEEYLLFTFADSLESHIMETSNLLGKNKLLIFIVNPRACATCVITSIEKLMKDYHSFLNLKGLKFLLLSDRVNSTLLGFLEKNGYDKSILFKLDTIKFRLPPKVDVLSLFVDEGRIIYTYALNSNSYKNLDLFYRKILRYVNDENSLR